MDFVRQRKLQAIDPVLGFVIAVALLIAGAGYWALIIGIVVGAWAGALVSLRACPYKLGLAFDRETLRAYVSFSWPLVLAGGAAVVVGQGLLIVGEAKLGLGGVGIIALASVISQYSDRADQAITQTIYPTICAVKDRADLLYEAFVKSNRLALMWGAPFGFGLALFAEDLVQFAIGERWRPGIGLMQAIGVAVAIHQIGFNWDAFYRALDRTKPVGVAAAIAIVAFVGIALPLLATEGLRGLALATLLVEGVNFAVRMSYLRRLFPIVSLHPPHRAGAAAERARDRGRARHAAARGRGVDAARRARDARALRARDDRRDGAARALACCARSSPTCGAGQGWPRRDSNGTSLVQAASSPSDRSFSRIAWDHGSFEPTIFSAMARLSW